MGQYDALVKGGLWAVLGVIGMVAMLTWQPDYKLTILTLGVSGILLLQNFMAVWRMRGAGHSYTIDGIGLARLILAATIATGFSWAAKLVLSPGPLLQVLLTSVVMALIYIVIVREIKAFREDERYMFSQMSKRLEWLV